MASTVLEPTVTVIRPSKGWRALNFREIWEYRELLYFLVWRDVKVRYKQTALGAAWAILQPLLATVIFTVFFGRLANIPSDGVPYPLFAFTAMLPWQIFAHALGESGNSLVANQHLITKVYFPRVLIPTAAVLAGLVDFAIAFLVLLAMLLYFQVMPGIAILMLPLFVALAIATALAVGLWLSALNVKYRDVRYTLPFLTQIWFFLTPVVYPSSQLPEPWRTLYGINPMAGVVEGFRWAMLGVQPGSTSLMIVSVLTVVALLIGGMLYFRRVERTFADVV
jgi:lipopolysaccharide transport system permease protein